MRANEFINEDVPAAGTDTEREVAQAIYMEGRCGVLAIAINQANPERYKLGYIYEYNVPGTQDVYLDPDEFDALDPEEQQQVKLETQSWALVHAYVVDQQTKEYIDARGRHSKVPDLNYELNLTRKNVFPATSKDIVDITVDMKWNDATEEWDMVKGIAAWNQLGLDNDIPKALDYAVKYLNIDLSKRSQLTPKKPIWMNPGDPLPPSSPNGTWVILGPYKNVLYRFFAPNEQRARSMKDQWCKENNIDPDSNRFCRLKYDGEVRLGQPIKPRGMPVVENTNQAAVDALMKKHGWSMGRTANGDLAFTWQGSKYEFFGERVRITLPDGKSISVVWNKKPDWQGRGNDELSFAQAVQNKYLTFDLPIWQALNRGQLTDSQAIQKFKAENERQAREAVAQGQLGVAEGATVTRIDSKPITNFGSNLKAYKHTDDWSQSGVDTGDDSYWKNKNLKTNTTKGLFAGDPRRTALYATGNAYETRYVEFTQDGQPIVYFDRKDLPAMRSRKTYLTVFDASDFRQLPTGEWFSENPRKPIKQVPIGDPFKYIADQGWIVRVTDDLDKVFKQVQKMHKAGKIAHYGAEGMNESTQGVAEGSLNEASSDEAWELVGQPVPEIQQFVKQMGYGNDEQSIAKITSIIDRVPATQMPAASIPKLKNLANKGNDAQTLKSILQISGSPDAERQYTKLMQARDAGEGRNRDVSGYIQYVKSGNYDPPVLLKLPTGVYVIGGRTRLYAALALGVPANVKIISANNFKQGVAEGSLTEIENFKQSDFRGGKDSLDRYSTPGKKHLRALPGGSDLMYSITSTVDGTDVHIVDPGIPGITKPSIVAGLSLYQGVIPDSVQVGSITVDEDYRGRGLAKALYGIVLTIMKKTLISGSSQTPGGRRNWLSLASIPGVEIKGLLDLYNFQLEKVIDQLMQLGGQFVARDNDHTYWAFDVVPGNGQLAPAVKNKLSKLYGYDSDNLLMATWTGGKQVVAEDLTEVVDLDTAFPLKWDQQFAAQGEIHAAATDADGREIGISFTPAGNGEITDVAFTRGGTHEMTGRGDAGRVMATVIKAINIYANKYKPPYLAFSAKSSGGRSSAYTAMIRRYAQGYELLPADQYPAALNNYLEFIGSDQPFVLART